jgi:hypothetical protein
MIVNGLGNSCSLILHAVYWSVLVTSDGFLRSDSTSLEQGELSFSIRKVSIEYFCSKEISRLRFSKSKAIQGYKQACNPPAPVSFHIFCLGRVMNDAGHRTR